jgi:DNA-binding NarL/FixJ family response regulator/tetratricopeptide (TPR) repeat protein
LWLGAALRVLPRSGPLHEGRSDTVLGYGRALALSGDLDGSRSVLRELIRDGEPLRAEAGAVSATVVRLRGGLDEAATLLHAELVRAVPRPAAEGMLRVELAVNAVLREDAESAAEHARRAIELLDVGQPALAAAAHAMLAVAALHTGDTRATAEHATGAARLADAVGDPALRLHIELFVPLAWVEMRLGRLDAAARHLARAGDLAGKTGQRSVLPNLLVVESAVQARRGRLPQALETADRAAAAARLIGSGELEAMADAARLRPLLWVSGPAAVVGLADQLSAAASPAAPMWRRAVELDRTLACLAAGDDADCLAPVNEADPHTVVVRQAIRTITLARAGELGAARAAARRAADTATASGLPYENGLAAYAEANLAARTGRPDQAAARAAAAAQRFAEAQAPLEAALAHHLAGVHWGRGGRSDESRAAFDRARDGYLACGASWLLTVLAGQRARATTGQRAPVAADNGLTTRELEIASLVSAGLSNKDVAARLFLSHRTVESHLSRIFAKLEIRSRVGLANRVRDIVRASA